MESQLGSTSPRGASDSAIDEDDNRTYIFVLTSPEDKDKPDSSKRRYVVNLYVQEMAYINKTVSPLV